MRYVALMAFVAVVFVLAAVVASYESAEASIHWCRTC
jgi:hypothetical protein